MNKDVTAHILDSDTFKKASSFGNYLLNICNQISVKYRTFISLSTSPNSRDWLHFITLWEEGMLQDLVRRTLCWKSFGFLSSDNKEKWNLSLPPKCPAPFPLLSLQLFHLRSGSFVSPARTDQGWKDTNGRREEKTSVDGWDGPRTECGVAMSEKLKVKWSTWIY